MMTFILGILFGVICFIGWIVVSTLVGVSDGLAPLGGEAIPWYSFWNVMMYVFGLGMIFIPSICTIYAMTRFVTNLIRKARQKKKKFTGEYLVHDYMD